MRSDLGGPRQRNAPRDRRPHSASMQLTAEEVVDEVNPIQPENLQRSSSS